MVKLLYILVKLSKPQDPNKPRLTGVAGTNEAAFVKSDKQAEYVPVFVDTPKKTIMLQLKSMLMIK